MGVAAIERGDHPHRSFRFAARATLLGRCGGFGRGQGWRGEVGHHALQVARAYDDVRVVDEQVGIARVRNKLDEVADLPVGPKAERAFDQSNWVIGKLDLEMLHCLDGRVFKVGDAEEDVYKRQVDGK